MDGATPPVQTIIFENTNFKSNPADLGSKGKYSTQLKSHRFEKGIRFIYSVDRSKTWRGILLAFAAKCAHPMYIFSGLSTTAFRYFLEGKLDSFDSNVANFGIDSSNSELPNKQDPLQIALSFNKVSLKVFR